MERVGSLPPDTGVRRGTTTSGMLGARIASVLTILILISSRVIMQRLRIHGLLRDGQAVMFVDPWTQNTRVHFLETSMIIESY